MLCIDEKTQLLHDRLTRIEDMLSAVINRLDDPAYVIVDRPFAERVVKDDQLNKRFAALEDATNNLCRRLDALNLKAKAQAEITNGLCLSVQKHDVSLNNLASPLNDLHSRLADIEGNAVLIQNGVIVPVKKG